jgi:hypothetical protein
VVRDRGSIVLGWLVRVTLCLAVLAVIGFEALSIGVTHVAVQDIATESADAAQTAWAEDHNPASAYRAAQDYAQTQGATIPPRTFVVRQDGSMHFVVHKTASTLVLYRIHPLAHWADVTYPVDVAALTDSGSLP